MKNVRPKTDENLQFEERWVGLFHFKFARQGWGKFFFAF